MLPFVFPPGGKTKGLHPTMLSAILFKTSFIIYWTVLTDFLIFLIPSNRFLHNTANKACYMPYFFAIVGPVGPYFTTGGKYEIKKHLTST